MGTTPSRNCRSARGLSCGRVDGVEASRCRRACGGSVCGGSGDGVRAPQRRRSRPGTTREASQGPPTPSARRPESRDRAPASQASNTTILESLSAPDPVSPGIGPKSEKRPPAAIILRNEAFAPSEGTATLQNAALRTREKDPQHEAHAEPRKRYSRDNIQQRVGLRVHDLRGRMSVSCAATASERVVRRHRRILALPPAATCSQLTRGHDRRATHASH